MWFISMQVRGVGRSSTSQTPQVFVSRHKDMEIEAMVLDVRASMTMTYLEIMTSGTSLFLSQ